MAASDNQVKHPECAPNDECALSAGLRTAFLDEKAESDPFYRAQFLSNVPETGTKVHAVIEEELKHSECFAISVAFVTMGGIALLKQTLAELAAKKIPGRILTTDYLRFSDPRALRQLAALPNLDVRLYRTGAGTGFHTKGYIFQSGELCRVIVGSSNLTMTALTTNREWNARVVSKTTGEFASHLMGEFETLWASSAARPLAEVIDQYEREYHAVSVAQREAMKTWKAVEKPAVLEPNAMQRAFVKNLTALIEGGAKRALLISATGTGKTYAAAFAAKQIRPARILFLIHREQIARQAKESFEAVLGNVASYGFYTGNEQNVEATCLFATVQTASKEANLKRFAPDAFDLIIIDEVHRAGAPSYRRIMDYFAPRLWLGMTASPDRPDGEDIYGLFDHNIAYEIRLQTALEENLLCPFHYYGLSDVSVGGQVLDDAADFRRLTSDERVRHILERADYFSWSGERVKGLVFCSTNNECRELARRFSEKGRPAVALSGEDSQERRREMIYRLTHGEAANRLDYIFTVDIFNEGVDIPEVNQVILLRPTESAIVFIQQLGRGLRKSEGKEFVVILDFIGAYQSNFLIPVALSGDLSYDKDNMRRYVSVSSRLIPGASSVHFDEVSRERIFAAIDGARTNEVRLLRESYQILRNKLGRIPRLTDFEPHNSIDPVKFFDNRALGSYHAFLKKYEPDYDVTLTAQAEKMLGFFSSKLGKGKRISEALLLEAMLRGEEGTAEEMLRRAATAFCGVEPDEEAVRSAEIVLAARFMKTQDERAQFADAAFLEENEAGEFVMSAGFKKALRENGDHFRAALEDLIAFMKERWTARFAKVYPGTDLVLYEKYTYEDVCRLLRWTRNMNAQNLGGYFYEKTSKTLPVFVNYEKSDGAIAYEDRFESPTNFIALSKTKRGPDSPDADHIFKRRPEDRDNRIFLFLRRNKDDAEAKAFYFLGEMDAVGEPIPVTVSGSDGKPVRAFEVIYKLREAVRPDIYQYLTGEVE